MGADLASRAESVVPATLSTLAAELDALSPEGRAAAIGAMGRRAQARLYEACRERGDGAGLEFLVPPDLPAGATAVFLGKNSLPLFSRFQKRFARREGEPGVLVGYNHQALAWLTGPGHFQVRLSGGTLLFDYTWACDRAPAGWPAPAPNDRGLSRWVFMNMHDVCWPIGLHTLIGAAFDGPTGKPKGQTFLLTRGAVLPAGGN